MDKVLDTLEGIDQRASGTITVVDFEAIKGIKATGTIEILDFSLLTEEAAVPSGVITFGAPSNGDTIVLTGLPGGNKTFTKAAAAGVDEFSTIGELTTLIDDLADLEATDDATDITITVATGGIEMNDAVITGTGAYSALNITFSGGQDHAVIEVDGDNYTEGTDFDAETSNDITATNLAAAIDGGTNDVDAAAVAAVVTVTAELVGVAGNAITMSVDSGDEDGVELSGATLEGGQDAATFTIDNTVFTEGAGEEWVAETDNETTAENIMDAIIASAETVDAVLDEEDPTTVIVYWDAPGTVGNDKALLSSDEVNLAVSGATLSGGVSATYSEEFIYGKFNPQTVEFNVTVSNFSGTNITITPQFASGAVNGNVTWIDGTALAAFTADGAKRGEETNPLERCRFKCVLTGTNPTADVDITVMLRETSM